MEPKRFDALINGIRETEFSQKQLEAMIDIILSKSKGDNTGDIVYEKYLESVSVTGGKKQDVQMTTENAAWRLWANAQKSLDGATEEEQMVSYYIYDIGGFSPSLFKKNFWLKSIKDLLQASDNNVNLVKEGIEKGQTERVTSNLTFSGPQSFLAYVRSVSSMEMLRDRGFITPDKQEEEIWA